MNAIGPIPEHTHERSPGIAKIAALWIRDGVLVNRMHLNPVVFALCYWLLARTKDSISFEQLVNFGFHKSGMSCAEKMHAFNNEISPALDDVDRAANLYNQVASEAAKSCAAFSGAEALLAELKRSGVANFITSAVEQSVLDQWAETSEGRPLAANLTEILGRRDNFSKGREHFAYLAEKLSVEKMIYVADAVSEIETAKKFEHQFNLTAIGFGNVIERTQVMDAFRLAQDAARRLLAADAVSLPGRSGLPSLSLDAELIELPTAREVERSLYAAGAKHVVTGSADVIMENLRQYLLASSILS